MSNMRLLIVGLVKNIQLDRIREEAEKNGHVVDGCYTADLAINTSSEHFDIYIRGEKVTDNYDLIYLWTVGKRRWEWYTAAYYLNKTYGTKIVNNKAISSDYNYYLTPASDYLKQYESKLEFPKSIVAFSPKHLDKALESFEFPVIIKRSNGRQGKGVYKINSKEELEAISKEILQDDTSFVIREFIPNDGDIRIFTVGYKAIGGMLRTPKVGDFRSNISQGGSGEAFDLQSAPEIREIAEKMSEITQTEVAGVDIIIDKNTNKPYVLEINPGPQFEGLEKYTGVNAAGEIVKYFDRLHSGE